MEAKALNSPASEKASDVEKQETAAEDTQKQSEAQTLSYTDKRSEDVVTSFPNTSSTDEVLSRGNAEVIAQIGNPKEDHALPLIGEDGSSNSASKEPANGKEQTTAEYSSAKENSSSNQSHIGVISIESDDSQGNEEFSIKDSDDSGPKNGGGSPKVTESDECDVKGSVNRSRTASNVVTDDDVMSESGVTPNVLVSHTVKEKLSTMVQLGLQRAVKSSAEGDENSETEGQKGSIHKDRATFRDGNTLVSLSDTSDKTSTKRGDIIIISNSATETETTQSDKDYDNSATDVDPDKFHTLSTKRITQLSKSGDETMREAARAPSDKSCDSELGGLELGDEINGTEVVSSKLGSCQETDNLLITYLSGDRSVESLDSGRFGENSSKPNKIKDPNNKETSSLQESSSHHQEFPINDREGSQRLGIEVPKEAKDTNEDGLEDWLDDSQKLVIAEQQYTSGVDDKEIDTRTKSATVEQSKRTDQSISHDPSVSTRLEMNKTDSDASHHVEEECKASVSHSKSMVNATVTDEEMSTKDMSIFTEKVPNLSTNSGTSDFDLTQMLLQLLAPTVYTVKPGKRQIKGSFLNCTAKESFRVWQGVFNQNVHIFHCPFSSCQLLKTKCSYTEIVLHLLLGHQMAFGVVNRQGEYFESRKDTNMYCCTECSFKSAHSIVYLEHIRCHFIKYPYKCLTCPSSTNSEYNDVQLVDHLKTEHKGKLAQSFNISIQYDIDLHTFLWKHRFICPACTSVNAFYYLPLYVCHLAEHSPFTENQNLSCHDFHYDSKSSSYECRGCDYRTEIADAFFEHVRVHLTEAKAVYKCEECNRMFKSLLNFRVHQTTVHPKTFPDIVIIPDSQPQIDEIYHMMHMFQTAGASGGNSEDHSKTEAVEIIDGGARKAHDKQQTKEATSAGQSGNIQDAAEDDLVTYSHCKAHNFLTSNYVQYILHLRKEHDNFTNVNFIASQGKNNTIAFKDGYYVCTGCLIKTDIREVFQEHMRCHTLTLPYQCTSCQKDFRDIYTPHSPCWDEGDSHVDFIIKPSPTMEDVMKKLGPLAPATNKTTDIVYYSKAGAQLGSAATTESASQVILLDDDSGDEVEILENPPKPVIGASTPARQTTTAELGVIHNLSAHSDTGPSATSTPQRTQPSETSASTLVRNTLGAKDSSALVQSSASGGNIQSLGATGTLSRSSAGIGGFKPLVSSTESGNMPQADKGPSDLATSVPSLSVPTDMISIGEPLEAADSLKSKCYSYVYSDGYFQCGACDFRITATEEESFRYHVYCDVHVGGVFKKPCAKCGNSGFTPGQKLDCPLVNDVIKKLLRQKTSSIPTPNPYILVPAVASVSPDKSTAGSKTDSEGSFKTDSHKPQAALPNLSISTVQTSVPSINTSVLPAVSGSTLSSGVTPVQGTQLLCGLVNGTLVPLGSVVNGEIVQRTTDHVLLGPSAAVPEETNPSGVATTSAMTTVSVMQNPMLQTPAAGHHQRPQESSLASTQSQLGSQKFQETAAKGDSRALKKASSLIADDGDGLNTGTGNIALPRTPATLSSASSRKNTECSTVNHTVVEDSLHRPSSEDVRTGTRSMENTTESKEAEYNEEINERQGETSQNNGSSRDVTSVTQSLNGPIMSSEKVLPTEDADPKEQSREFSQDVISVVESGKGSPQRLLKEPILSAEKISLMEDAGRKERIREKTEDIMSSDDSGKETAQSLKQPIISSEKVSLTEDASSKSRIREKTEDIMSLDDSGKETAQSLKQPIISSEKVSLTEDASSKSRIREKTEDIMSLDDSRKGEVDPHVEQMEVDGESSADIAKDSKTRIKGGFEQCHSEPVRSIDEESPAVSGLGKMASVSSYIVPDDTASKGACSDGQTVVKGLNDDSNSVEDLVELSDGSDSGVQENSTRLVKQKTVLSCDIVKGTYKCLTCNYSSTNGMAFKQHMWKHIHKKSMACEHVEGKQHDKMKKCPVIIALVQLLIAKSKQKLKPQERVVHEKRFAESPPPISRKKRRKVCSDEHDVMIIREKENEAEKIQNIKQKQTEVVLDQNVQQKQTKDINVQSSSQKQTKDVTKEEPNNSNSENRNDNVPQATIDYKVNTSPRRKRAKSESHVQVDEKLASDQPIGTDIKDNVDKDNVDIQAVESSSADPQVVETLPSHVTQEVEERAGDSGEEADVETEEDIVDDFELGEEQLQQEITFQKISHEEAILSCPVTECRFSNDDVAIFTQHLETKHSHLTRFRCGCCKNATSLDVESLVLHMQRQEREDHKYGCVFCGFLTATVEIFEAHLQEQHTQRQEFYCSYCETPFPTIAGLVAHLHVNVAKMYKCPYCEKSAPTRKSVLSHLPRSHPGQQRRAVESTVVYCENKQRLGHSILGSRSVTNLGRQKGTIPGDRKPETPPRADSIRSEQQSGSSNKKLLSPPPLIPSSSSSVNRPGAHRQDSNLEGSASNMECTYCKFTAFSKAQLEHHELWHEEPDAIPGKAFQCTLCQCTVEEFANFKFHLQFHPGDHKLKYYKCGGCNSYKSNVEDKMEAHHKAQHADARDGSSSEDDEATYMVAKLKVGFHNGKIMCPTENCTEAYEHVIELQEHLVQKHGSPLSDGHRQDFYILENTSNISAGGGHVTVHRSPDQAGNNSNPHGINKGNAGKENQRDNTNRGHGGSNYGKKRGDDDGRSKSSDDDNDEPMDEANAIVMGNGCHVNEEREEGEIMVENVGLINDIDLNDCELPDMTRDITSNGPNHDIETNLSGSRADLHTPQFETATTNTMEEEVNSEANLLESEVETNSVGPPKIYSPAPIVVVPDDCDNEEAETGNVVEALDVTTVDEDYILPDDNSANLANDSLIEDSKEGILPMQQSESGDFIMPTDPAWMKCTYCFYATRHKKSYVKHIETHEKFKTYTGNAFKCAYCAFMSQAKAPAMRHLRNFHPGRPSKMYYVRLVVGKTMSEMEMMAEFGMSSKSRSGGGGRPKVKADPGVSASSPDVAMKQKKSSKTKAISSRLHSGQNVGGSVRGAGSHDDQYLYEFEASLPQQIVFDTGVQCPRCDFVSKMREELVQHLRVHLFSHSSLGDETDDDIDSGLGTMELDPKNVKQEGGGSIPSHQDPDWFMELTKEEAAFCNKVSGLGLFQCKLCMHMDPDSNVVRSHYVQSHPEELPILCGYCRERCDHDSFRKHHQDCHAMHPVKMIKLALSEQSGKKFLDVHAGELEMEEVMHEDGRLNDWTEAMRPFVSAEKSGTYRCNFCNYAQYGTSALKRHVFPIHFKQYPYECMYCQIGMTQVNQMKSHIIKMHPSLPIRIRKPLPPEPSEEEIQQVVDITSPRRMGSPARSPSLAGTRGLGSSSTSRGLSPAATLRPASPRNTRTPKSDITSRDLLSPCQIKQEINDADTMEDSLSQCEQYSEAEGFSQSVTSLDGGVKSLSCRSFKKMFKCHYCQHTSKWTARDVQRHILTTHLGLKLFNCCYCDFGCYSRNRLETHVYLEHPGKQFRVANLDKRMNSVQVVRDTDDGVEILALFKPNGEPVYHLDPTKRDVLRKYTLSGRYFNTTTRASPIKKDSPSPTPTDSRQQAMDTDESELSFPIFADEDEEEMHEEKSVDKSNIPLWPKKLSTTSRVDDRHTPEEMGQKMRKSVPKNGRSLATSWRCKMCGLLLLRNDRIKYHIICHHWKMRPYRCPYCDAMKYQKDPVHQHIKESHPGYPLSSISICEEKVEELNSLMERVENTEPLPDTDVLIKSENPTNGILKKPGPSRGSKRDAKDGALSSDDGGQTEASSLLDEDSNGFKEEISAGEAYECVKCTNFVGDITSMKDHVIRVHLKHRLYICEFCDTARNEISTMVEHIQKMHPDMPQRFSHAYGKFKEEVDSMIKPAVVAGGGSSEILGDVSHVSEGGVDGSLKCPACNDVCKNQADFDWHLAEEHPQYVKYQCGYCQVLSDNKRELKNHLVDYHSDKQPDYTFVRNLPPSFRAIMAAKQHAKRTANSTNQTKPCKLCHYTASSLATLNNHMESHHLNQSLFQCRLCSGLHKTKADLLVHYGVLHRNDPLQYKVIPLGAEEDDEDEDQPDVSDISTRPKPQPTVFRCEYCLYEGTSKVDVKQHTDENHGTEQEIMEGIENQSESILRNVLAGKGGSEHKKIVLRYECKHCNYQTRECVTIRRHVMTHINYKPYSCPLCNTNSIRSNTVKSHLRLFHKNNTLKPRYMKNAKMESMIHQSIDKIYATRDGGEEIAEGSQVDTSERPFKSPATSSKRYGRPSVGEYSARSAGSPGGEGETEETESEGGGGQVKYSCKLCGYSYHGTSQNIRRHVMVHFNYRKFRCPYCDFTAVQSNNVTQHIQGIHENQPIKYLTVKYKCAHRDLSAVQSCTVTKHMAVKHKDLPQSNFITVRDEDMERRLDDAIVKFGTDSSPQAMLHRKKLEKVTINQGKGLSFKGEAYNSDGRKSQLGVNKPRKLPPEKIVAPRPGQCLYYKCKICNFTENSSSRKCTNIRRHVMSHLNYKRYVCPYCPFGATTTCMTKQHTMRKHVGKRVYWLDKKDPVMEKLMRANIIKVGGKPWTTYNYEDGGTPFKQKPKEAMIEGATSSNEASPTSESHLKSPMVPIRKVSLSSTERMKVTAELAEEDRGFGNYQCKFCKKRLANSSAIKRHVAAHFYYRRYGCPYCELLFTQSTFAVNHVRAKHKGMAVYYMDNKDPKMEAKIRRAWVNISAEEESEVFNAAGIVRGAGKRKIKKPQKAFQLEQELLRSIKCEDESSILQEAGQEGMGTNFYGEENGADSMGGLQENSKFKVNHLGMAAFGPETASANETSEQDKTMKVKAFKCCQCNYETEHKTSMIRHVMWKIGYKPYLCALCSFTDVLYIGLKRHAVRKHKHHPFNPIITKDPEKEAEVEEIMTRSTVHLAKGASIPSSTSVLEETDTGNQPWPDGDDFESFPALPEPVTVKIEPGLESCDSENLYDNQSRGEARFPKPRGENKGHKTSDEPIPEAVVRRSVNKSRCEICGKMSSSKGYIYNHVIRHGPPKLRCGYCHMCFYFPKEAKTHNERKHPESPLKVKRLWGTSNWDKKTEGIEPADPIASGDAAPKLPAMDTEDNASFDEEDEAGNSILGDEPEFGDADSPATEYNGSLDASKLMDIDMPVFPQPEATMVERSTEVSSMHESQGHSINQALKNVDFEESILERTPVRIPVKDPVTGLYVCFHCSYASKNPTHIKCHMLTHQPPHWRCDHCRKTFIMLYKLRKHSSTVHKFQPLTYTNLVTGENCIGSKINYEGAVFPNRESKADKDEKILAAASFPVDNTQDSSSDSESTDNESQYSQFDAVSVSSEPAVYESIRLHCPCCDFVSVSEQELLMHLYLHRSHPEWNRDSQASEEPGTNSTLRCALCDYTTQLPEELAAHRSGHSVEKPYQCGHCDYCAHLQTPVMLHCLKAHAEEKVSVVTKDLTVQLDVKTAETATTVDFNPKHSGNHCHPSIELRNFLDLPIELLHAFMVQNGLSEIHQ